jgi:hypothetical protein
MTTESTEAVLPSSAEQKQLVWSAYVRTLKAMERTRSVREAARSNLAEAVALFETRRKAGVPENQLQTLREQIETLKEIRRQADADACAEQRRADQLLVNLLAAEHICDVLDSDSPEKARGRKHAAHASLIPENARWN